MGEYIFGVMSNKWKLYAPGDIIAKIAMSLFVRSNVPIVIYAPVGEAFWPKDVLTEANLNQDNEQIRTAFKSIMDVRE